MIPLPSHINLVEKINQITKPWTPIDVARFNDQVVRLALFKGEYHWHRHENEDELFYVYKGNITIHIRGQNDLVLKEGEMGLVPKGIEHCPRSDGDSYVLMFEPVSLQSAGV